MNVSITNSDFQCSNEVFDEKNILLDTLKINSSSPSAIFASNIKLLEMHSNTFKNCYKALVGGVLRLDET